MFYESKFQEVTLFSITIRDISFRSELWTKEDLENEDPKPEEIAKEIRIMFDCHYVAPKAESMFDLDVDYTAEQFIGKSVKRGNIL